jgi:uncharacterized glyoxalase superfamily protein PhnB
MVRDVRSSIEYYQDVLGFELNAWVENEANPDIYDFAMISFDGLVLMLQDAASLQADHPDMKGICIGQSLTLFFKVLDVTELYKTLKRKTTIYKEPYDTFYGTREFCVRDPNGYILTFAQDVEPETEA